VNLQLKFHGVRGSRPTHKNSLLGFGGNSTSLQFMVDGDFYLFIDGGSGLAACGREMGQHPKNKRFHFLITHTHWDHILGFPLFEPMYNPENHMTFYASNTEQATFKNLFLGLREARNLPIPKSMLRAQLQFQEIAPDQRFVIENAVEVSTFQLNHQGVTLGYRLEYQGSSCCFVTDMAPIANGNWLGEGQAQKAQADPVGFEKQYRDAFVNFLKGAHTVVFDTHFVPQNLKPDWGHSTPEIALSYAAAAKNSRLILFHHAPEDSDQDVLSKVKSIEKEAINANIEVVAAKEGTVWNLA